MRQVLIIKNKWAEKRIIMPAISETDCTINIFQKNFWIEDDVSLRFFCKDNIWFCREMDAYRILRDGQRVSNISLADDVIFDIQTSDSEILNVRVEHVEQVVTPYVKLNLDAFHKVVISTDEKSDIRISSEQQFGCRLRRVWNGWDVRPEGDCRIYYNGSLLSNRITLKFGDVISFEGFEGVYLTDMMAVRCKGTINENFLKKASVDDKDGNTRTNTPRNDNGLSHVEYIYQPSARILPEIIDEEISIEDVPADAGEEDKTIWQIVLQSLLMVAPMMIGSVFIIIASEMSGLGGSPLMYASAVMAISSAVGSGGMAVYTYRQQKKKKEKNDRHKAKAYEKYIRDKVSHIKEIYEHNYESLNSIYPESRVCLDYNISNGKLYDRNSSHCDFLKIRVGKGEVHSRIKINIPADNFKLFKDEFTPIPEYINENYKTLYDAPILLELGNRRIIGIVGGQDKKNAVELSRVIALQLAANHSYADVKMAFLYDKNSSDDSGEWDFARFIPHAFSSNRDMRLIGTCEHEIRDVGYALGEIFRTREERLSENVTEKNNDETKLPHYVVFLSDIKLLNNQLISHYILGNDGEIGLTAIILSDTFSNLPNACNYVLQADSEFSGIVETVDNCQHRHAVEFDEIDKDAFTAFCRDICGIKVAEYSNNTGVVPNQISFLDMYGVETIEGLSIYNRWQRNKVFESMRALLGFGAGNVPVYLDVHEKYHGPHGLVAGTTGSGKSETLQTYMLSLAVEFCPDDVAFFVIDYKGGGMSNLFDGLPHLSGSISNLSGSLVRRAMVAIKSENKRRQRLFNAAGVNNINKYSKYYKAGKVSEPIPHLFIIIDEFAELKREEPDFMKDLISVAQVGRSLGVHLILSTQKPSGTVDDNIWSNSKFRLCLAVQTKEDSHDMLGKNDAAYITQAGRGYLQVGNDELYQLFQSGYSGGAYNPDNIRRKNASRCLTITGAEEIIAGNPERDVKQQNVEEISLLNAVKKHIEEIASQNNYAPVHKLWLPALMNKIGLSQLPGYEEADKETGGYKQPNAIFELNAVVGLLDDPVNQAQNPLVIDFANGGHHGIIGLSQTGKSTFIQTILYALVNKYSPENLNIYCLDFSSHVLAPFEHLAHTGGVIFDQDDDKLERFFFLINSILEERKKEFSGGNFAQYYRANGPIYPAIIVAIDNYSSLASKSSGKYVENILTLAKEGEANGIYMLISAAGIGMNEISNRLAGSIKSYICLALKDKYAYTDFLHAISVDVMPESGVPGRGLCLYDGRVLEYQAALSSLAEDDYGRINDIKRRCDELNELSTGVTAKKIPQIPDNPTYEEFVCLPEVKAAVESLNLVPIGYDTRTATAYSINLLTAYCYLITGSKRSARINLQKILLKILSLKKGKLVYMGKEQPAISDAVDKKVVFLDNKVAACSFFQTELTEHYKNVRKFKKQLSLQGLPDEVIMYKVLEQFDPVYIIIRDLRELEEMMKSNTDINEYLKYIFQKGKDHCVYFFGALEVPNRNGLDSSIWLNDFVAYKTGIHIGGNISSDNYLNFRYMKAFEMNEQRKDNLGQISDSVDDPLTTTQAIIPSNYNTTLMQ